ncbi:hypothetical protein [Pseudoxanthomonas sp. SE1]|uniref:hypothetical protein n=1 Tax=Pseudoxanthomonas sp. SE1 TaxID=1664560 RepID=UPI00240D7D6A|nr:hypothetical protein [Pseudoxanthomonas sp. SE1]WFC43703.1 hypothetical protein OY559_09470 [Pseudoxanthomonas sp. SE1]
MNPRLLPSLLFVAGLAPLAAQAGEPVTACVSLGNDQEIIRAGSGEQFYLRDGQSHYRVAFRNSCAAITMTPTVEISTNGQLGQLCPQDTEVMTKRGNCRVSAVEQITADEFAARKRRARQ